MIRDTHPYKISEIFSNEKDIIYKVPKYQREYTWGQKEWNLLFEDIIGNENGYFLGSIICVNTSSSSMNTIEFEVIDGQQRLTTLSILLVSIYSKLLRHKTIIDNDEELLTDLNNIKRELIITKTKELRFVPQIQNKNRDDYSSLLSESNLINVDSKPLNAGNRRIYKSYNYFGKLIDQYIEEQLQELRTPDEDKIVKMCELLFDLSKKFNSAILVLIEVETHKDAYMLFESLNNRGIPLSAIDLIKNLLISVSEKDNMSEEVYEDWKKILNYLTDDYAVQERFFRQFYNAYREELNIPFRNEKDIKKYPLSYLATKNTILEIYDKLIKKDYKKMLERLKNEAKQYSIIINKADEKNYIFNKELLNLERIQGSPSYLLLLYLFSNKENLDLADEILKNIIEFLAKFFVRRNLTDIPSTRNLNKIFMDIIENIQRKKHTEILETIKSVLISVSANDETFIDKLQDQIYENNDTVARYLLCYYEDKFNTKEKRSDLWGRDRSNKYIWTIEHIFPEGENIPQYWTDMIANGDKNLATEYFNKYVHTLGNLTITGYNQNLSNMSFVDKRDRKKDGNYIGYKNGLELNEDLANKEKWTKDDIVCRTEKLIKVFREDFKL